MSKKWKIALGFLAAVLVFFLWYTRPRGFEELVGDGEIKNYSMLASPPMTVENGKPYQETWQMDSYEGRENTAAELKKILTSCKYRASLQSFLPPAAFNGIPGDGNILITLSVVLNDDSNFIGYYKGRTATIDGLIIQADDPEISEKLLVFAQAYGWQAH